MQKLLLVVSLFLFACGFSQPSKYQRSIDSVSLLLKADKEDTTKVKRLFKLARDYSYLYKYDSALQYGKWSLRLNDSLFKVFSKNSAITHSLQKSKGVCYSVIGNACYDHGDYPGALTNLFEALKAFEVTGNKYNMGVAYTTIGLVYYYQGNYEEALKNHFAVLKIYETLGDKSGIGMAYNNIAIVYDDLKKYDESLKYHRASLKIKLELNDKEGLAASYNNIGLVYSKQESYREALKNTVSALKLYEELNDREGIALACFNMGGLLVKEKKYKEAEDYFLKAKELSIETHYRVNLKFTYGSLADLYVTKKDYKKAFEYRKLYVSTRDSLVNEESKEKVVEAQMTYDFEKKELVAEAEHQLELKNQKLLAEEKNRKQKIIMWCVVLGLLLVMVFAGVIFRSLNLMKVQKSIIETQKQEVEQQKHLVEEKQKEIIDSITYAKRLQQAILPSAEEMNKYLPNCFVLYQPKDIVAGDFYWMHIAGDLVFIAAADSTGHGVPGAMVSVICSNALNRSVDEFKLIDTGKILDKTRDLVLETFAKSGEEIKDGMDISLLCINKTKKQITWSGANNKLWYIENARGDSVNEIKADKQAIGKTDNPKPFTTHTLDLKTGDLYYLMTDGYPDQFGGPNGKKFKYKAMEEKLGKISHLPLEMQHEELMNVFNDWKGKLEQVDDVTIIGIKITT